MVTTKFRGIYFSLFSQNIHCGGRKSTFLRLATIQLLQVGVSTTCGRHRSKKSEKWRILPKFGRDLVARGGEGELHSTGRYVSLVVRET